MIGLNYAPINSGLGKYSVDINKIIPVYSVIADKTKKNYEYVGNVIKGIYPPITTGWAINSLLIPIRLHLHSIHKIHYLFPFNSFSFKGIVTIHDLYFKHREINNEIFLNYKIGKFKKWKILTVSKSTKRELMNYYGYENIEVVPLSVDNIFKNLNLNKEFDVLTVGDGMHKHNKDIRNMCNKLGLSHIHIGKDVTGFTNVNNEQLNRYYNKARVVIRFSDIEGFGIPTIESAFAGTNIILSDLPVFREIMPSNYPYFIKDLSEFENIYYKAIEKPFKFSNEWYENYKFSTFEKRMKKIYKEVEENVQ